MLFCMLRMAVSSDLFACMHHCHICCAIDMLILHMCVCMLAPSSFLYLSGKSGCSCGKTHAAHLIMACRLTLRASITYPLVMDFLCSSMITKRRRTRCSDLFSHPIASWPPSRRLRRRGMGFWQCHSSTPLASLFPPSQIPTHQCTRFAATAWPFGILPSLRLRLI